MKERIERKLYRVLLTLLIAAAPALAGPVSVRVTVTNLSPAGGTYITPVWAGFHDGTFDLFDAGQPASMAIERLAEDGNPSAIMSGFTGTWQGVLFGPVDPQIAPGQSTSMDFVLDSMAAGSMYFSYASMVIPSNDAFIANGNPMGIQVFDAMGHFMPVSLVLPGSAIWDAGTEVNDELPMNTAFLGQMAPNTGVAEGGVVMIHPGFMAPGNGGILDNPMFMNADFKTMGYQVASISISQVPEPSTLMLMLGAAGFLVWKRRAS